MEMLVLKLQKKIKDFLFGAKNISLSKSEFVIKLYFLYHYNHYFITAYGTY